MEVLHPEAELANPDGLNAGIDAALVSDVGASEPAVAERVVPHVTGSNLVRLNLGVADRVGAQVGGGEPSARERVVAHVRREDLVVDDVGAEDRVGRVGDPAGQNQEQGQRTHPLLAKVGEKPGEHRPAFPPAFRNICAVDHLIAHARKQGGAVATPKGTKRNTAGGCGAILTKELLPVASGFVAAVHLCGDAKRQPKRDDPPKRAVSGVQGGEIYVCVYVGGAGISGTSRDAEPR